VRISRAWAFALEKREYLLDQKYEECVVADEWAREQHKPLSNFDIARYFIDAIKVIGIGNGVGVLAAGAALNAFSNRPGMIFWIKWGGIVFLIGVIAFAFAFFLIHVSVSFFDRMLAAHRKNDAAEVRRCSDIASWSIYWARALAYVGALTFFIGCIVGLIVFCKV
jgi:hypothetical protein